MAYSQDLREWAIADVRAKEQSLDQIAETLGVSASTVDHWVRRWRAAGKMAALPWAGGVKRQLHDCAKGAASWDADDKQRYRRPRVELAAPQLPLGGRLGR